MRRLLSTVIFTQIVALIVLAWLLFELSGMFWYGVYLVAASVFMLYLPGYRWSFVFFSSSESTGFERFVMSLALSLGLVTLISYYAWYVGIVITPMFVFLSSAGLILLAYLIVLLTKRE